MEKNDYLIFMALKQESQGLFEAEGIKVYYTGVGKIKATYSAVKLIEIHKPKWVLNFGTAGSKHLPVGHLVECSQFVQRDTMFSLFPSESSDALRFPQKIYKTSAISDLPQVTCGTADFIDYEDSKAKSESRDSKPTCDIFDMEAYALAYVCDQQKVKFNSIKYITDSSDKTVLNDWTQNLQAASKALLAQLKKSLG